MRRRARLGPPPVGRYLSAAFRARTAAFKAPMLILVGAVQIASTTKVVAFALGLFMLTNQTSGTVEVASQSELLTLTVGSVDGVKLPPPVTTIPAGQTAT